MDDVEWDAAKAAANVKKHGVDFADAATVLHDENAVTVVVVVYTWRDERPRLISARLASAHERKQYEGKP